MYSKALRYTVSKSADLKDTRFLIGSKNIRDSWILAKFSLAVWEWPILLKNANSNVLRCFYFKISCYATWWQDLELIYSTFQFVSSSKNKQDYVYFLPVGNIRQKHSGTWLNSSAVVTLHTIHTNTISIRSL